MSKSPSTNESSFSNVFGRQMFKHILLAFAAFLVVFSLLNLAVNLLIFSVGLSGMTATTLSLLPVIFAVGFAWLIWSRARKRTQLPEIESSQEKARESSQRTARLQILALFLVFVSVFGGCTSWPLPPSLSNEQRAVLNATHIGGTVGVYRASFANQSDEIMDLAIQEVRATALFDRVDRLQNFDNEPTYRLEFRGVHWCSDTFPKPWLLLSLGVIPATEGACGGVSFRLYHGQSGRFVELNSWFKENAIHGWVAVFFNFSPDRTFGWDSPEKRGHPRFIDRLAWTIASKKAEIDNLL